MVFITTLGNAGIFWICLGLLLLAVPRTRKCGGCMLLSMALTFILGNLILKNMVARPRPFTVATDIVLKIPQPGEYSFPSGHTMNSFTAATTVFLFYKKSGIAAFVLAALIAFSRMYLFVHYPTDILGGIVLGIVDALLIFRLTSKKGCVKLNSNK
ncbi:MAG: phosphatase PAP2 family protein [Lachnospiraceae bacterium]|nr:phosphatase PAP2 family protein [Lachnospiraceae bacterium]